LIAFAPGEAAANSDVGSPVYQEDWQKRRLRMGGGAEAVEALYGDFKSLAPKGRPVKRALVLNRQLRASHF
jgi:hypothetical protein